MCADTSGMSEKLTLTCLKSKHAGFSTAAWQEMNGIVYTKLSQMEDCGMLQCMIKKYNMHYKKCEKQYRRVGKCSSSAHEKYCAFLMGRFRRTFLTQSATERVWTPPSNQKTKEAVGKKRLGKGTHFAAAKGVPAISGMLTVCPQQHCYGTHKHTH